MKHILITAVLCGVFMGSFAQKTKTDTLVKDTTIDKKSKHGISVTIGGDRNTVHVSVNKKDTVSHAASKDSGFSIGLTFSKFDLGLVTLVDNGSFSLSPQNSFLSYNTWKTSTVGFDVWRFGYSFTPKFKISLAAGFDWTLIRLQKDITILADQPTLTYRVDNIHYTKNRFSASYLHVPLYFDYRSNPDKNGNRFYFIASPEVGFLLNAMVKQKSNEMGKKKAWNDYHFAHFRYGAALHLGYGNEGIFFKYYFNDTFENSPAQNGLKIFSFGFTSGF